MLPNDPDMSAAQHHILRRKCCMRLRRHCTQQGCGTAVVNRCRSKRLFAAYHFHVGLLVGHGCESAVAEQGVDFGLVAAEFDVQFHGV